MLSLVTPRGLLGGHRYCFEGYIFKEQSLVGLRANLSAFDGHVSTWQ